jgi:hypothetical protein
MFHDRASRSRLTTLPVLTVLMLIGLGTGHVATRVVGAPSEASSASSRFADRPTDGLMSDGLGAYEHSIDCVHSTVSSQRRWMLLTRSNCPTYRRLRLKLTPVSVSPSFPGGSVSPHPNYASALSPPLDISGSGNPQDVWLQCAQTAFPKSLPYQGEGMSCYLRTDTEADPSASFTFRLIWQGSKPNPVSATESIITTDGSSPLVDVWKRIPGRPHTSLIWVGTFSVPFSVTVTKLPSS